MNKFYVLAFGLTLSFSSMAFSMDPKPTEEAKRPQKSLKRESSVQSPEPLSPREQEAALLLVCLREPVNLKKNNGDEEYSKQIFFATNQQNSQYVSDALASIEKGVPQNPAHWFHFSAKKGDAPSQFKLGILYLGGNGVPQDNIKAAKWFLLAANQGYTQAQDALTLLNSVMDRCNG